MRESPHPIGEADDAALERVRRFQILRMVGLGIVAGVAILSIGGRFRAEAPEAGTAASPETSAPAAAQVPSSPPPAPELVVPAPSAAATISASPGAPEAPLSAAPVATADPPAQPAITGSAANRPPPRAPGRPVRKYKPSGI